MTGDFMDTVEETALVVELDRYALAEACAQLERWQAQGAAADLFLNVNLSVQQFERSDFVAFLEELLDRTGFPPDRMNLEITENLLISRSEPVDSTIRQLKRLGVSLHIDDFGTGYSSLSYLQRFPANTLKIDRSFTQQLTQNGQGAELVKTMLLMARALDMKVVAEGVEIQEQLTQLKALSCAYGQGCLYAKPLSAEQALAFVVAA